MRLIDADALMKNLAKWIEQIDPTHPPEENAIPSMDDIIVSTMMTIEEEPTIEPQRWIPVTEALPEKRRETYWVCTDTEAQCECRWTDNMFGLGSSEWGWSIFDYPQYSKVVAWMPLPEPWRGWTR